MVPVLTATLSAISLCEIRQMWLPFLIRSCIGTTTTCKAGPVTKAGPRPFDVTVIMQWRVSTASYRLQNVKPEGQRSAFQVDQRVLRGRRGAYLTCLSVVSHTERRPGAVRLNWHAANFYPFRANWLITSRKGLHTLMLVQKQALVISSANSVYSAVFPDYSRLSKNTQHHPSH